MGLSGGQLEVISNGVNVMDVASIVAKFKKVPERLGIDVCSGGIKMIRLNRTSDESIEVAGRGFIDIDIDKVARGAAQQ